MGRGGDFSIWDCGLRDPPSAQTTGLWRGKHVEGGKKEAWKVRESKTEGWGKNRIRGSDTGCRIPRIEKSA